jgi:flavin reductase ActVB
MTMQATSRGDTGSAEERSRRFREAMASFPSGVTIVTTTRDDGSWCGFTATSFCSLSVDPPLVLVCLAKTAQCYDAFLATDSWVVQMVPPDCADLAVLFATRGADKFSQGDFFPNDKGHPVLTDACVVLECDAFNRYDGGDHTILVGHVAESHVRHGAPAVYFRRGFHALPS